MARPPAPPRRHEPPRSTDPPLGHTTRRAREHRRTSRARSRPSSRSTPPHPTGSLLDHAPHARADPRRCAPDPGTLYGTRTRRDHRGRPRARPDIRAHRRPHRRLTRPRGPGQASRATATMAAFLRASRRADRHMPAMRQPRRRRRVDLRRLGRPQLAFLWLLAARSEATGSAQTAPLQRLCSSCEIRLDSNAPTIPADIDLSRGSGSMNTPNPGKPPNSGRGDLVTRRTTRFADGRTDPRRTAACVDPLTVVLSETAVAALERRIEIAVDQRLHELLPAEPTRGQLSPWLDTKNAAAYLGISENALRLRVRKALVLVHR